VSSFPLAKKFGFGQGFSFYDDSFEPAESTLDVPEWEGFGVGEAFDRRGDHTTRRAVEWLAQRREPGRPFFLFIHYFDPHSPYAAPEPHGSSFDATLAEPSQLQSVVARYDGEILFTDASIGALLDALDELQLAENTIVIVSANHGEGLMQHGYMLHGIGVYEEEVRVPLLLRWPAVIRGGRAISEPVALVDLMPTVAALAGFEPAEGLFGGQSLAAALLGGPPLASRRPVYLQRRRFAAALVRPVLIDTLEDGREVPPVAVKGEQFALRTGAWKYILAPDEGSRELFDLVNDPGERENLFAEHPERSARLHAQLERWIDAQRGARTPPAAPSAQDRERLRALGYGD
jgi:arylsulfatase A-like enzyme